MFTGDRRKRTVSFAAGVSGGRSSQPSVGKSGEDVHDKPKISKIPIGRAPGLARHSIAERSAAKDVGVRLGKGFRELLWDTGHFFIREYVELLDEAATCQLPNSFEVANTGGDPIFYVTEVESNCLTRNCLGTKRCFTFQVTNVADDHLFTLSRDCSSCCSSIFCGNCPGNCVTLTNAEDEPLGKVRQRCGLAGKCTPIFDAMDKNREKVLTIQGPKCGVLFPCQMCGNEVTFKVSDNRAEKAGMIRKQWTGLLQETFTDADMFGAEFSESMEADSKILLLAAIFFIDHLYFGRGRGWCC